MGEFTRTYNRFEWWSVADCSCELCANYRGKKQPCPLDVCCIEDIQQEAVRREQGAASGVTTRTEAMLCPA